MMDDNIGRIQTELKIAFPEFNQKSSLIDYYVSFEFPEKQLRMVPWWQRVIEFIMNIEHTIFITYPHLVEVLTIMGLKPVPLQNILNFLRQKQIFVEENQLQNCQRNQQNAQKENNNSWLTKITGMWSQASTKTIQKFSFNGTEKIFSKTLKEMKKKNIVQQLQNIFNHCGCLDKNKLMDDLREKINLNRQSLEELLTELNFQKKICVREEKGNVIVLYSPKTIELHSEIWVQVQTAKHKLRQQVQKFEHAMGVEIIKNKKLKENARNYAQDGNKEAAKMVVINIVQNDKKWREINNRKTLLEQQLNTLEMNEMNMSSIELLEQAQNISSQMMVDPNKMEELIDRKMEIEIQQKEVNKNFEQLAEREGEEEDVNEMMKELEQEIRTGKKVDLKQNVKVQLKAGQWGKDKNRQKEERMEIEWQN